MTDKDIHINYRKATVEDAEAINNYLSKIGKESEFLTYTDYNTDLKEKIRHINYLNDHDDCFFLLAEHDGQIIGTFSYVMGWREGMLHEGEMGTDVLKEYWGCGIGTEFMTRFKQWAIGIGKIQRVELLVHCQNFRAINLYQKFGFKIEGRHDKKVCVNGKYADMFSMALFLE